MRNYLMHKFRSWGKFLRASVSLGAAAMFAMLVAVVWSAPAPNADSGNITIIVSKLLEQGHYLKHALNDATSKQFLEFYLDALDPRRLIFLQSDVDEFTKQYATH